MKKLRLLQVQYGTPDNKQHIGKTKWKSEWQPTKNNNLDNSSSLGYSVLKQQDKQCAQN